MGESCGFCAWVALPEERQACPGVSASGPESSPASHRDLLPWALTVGPQGPERAERVPAAARPWGQSPTRCACAPSSLYGPLGSGKWAGSPRTRLGLQRRNTRPLALPLLLGMLLLSLSLLSPPFFLCPLVLSLRSHQTQGFSDGFGERFPPDTEARPPCLLRSAPP